METVNLNQERWLRCQLDLGMFSDEIAVTYPAEGAAIRSVFVPKSAVNGKPGEKGRVRVRIMNSKSGTVYAVLPTNQSEMVAVTERDLSDSP